jgi:hypothetical protein
LKPTIQPGTNGSRIQAHNNESSSEKKKKLFQISPNAETSAVVPATLRGYHPVKFPLEYYSV